MTRSSQERLKEDEKKARLSKAKELKKRFLDLAEGRKRKGCDPKKVEKKAKTKKRGKEEKNAETDVYEN